MSEFQIHNANIVLPDRILENHCIIISDGKIKNISKDSQSNFESIDGKNNYLCPGFIDLHIHGMHEYLIDNGVDDIKNICKILPRYGVTGFLPTVCPLPKGRDSQFLKTLSQHNSTATKIYGFHLEGPFLTITGALPPEALGNADIQRVQALVDSAKPYKAIFSISPDFENITDLLPYMSKGSTPVFITHTKADVKQAQAAINAGACHATHFYDVFYHPEMTDPGVRPCGAVEAILADENTSVDFILDGEHVDPVAVKMALKCKGPDKVCLITDSNIGAGNKPGVYQFGKEKVKFSYPGAPARFIKNNTLAGSGLTMNKAVRNAVKLLDVDLPQAVRMASTNPAKVLKLENTGSIKVDHQADLVLINENFEVLQTWINGKCCYKNTKE